ncbi:MAG: hypothetical protein WC310_04135 [Patescibacteria group bacterium]|jgi:type II secretory pathway pseudopilin PulG
MNKVLKNKKGQTLLEIVFVLLILLSAATVLMSTYFYSNRAQGVDLRQSLGSQFAREGLDFVRNLRDSNWLNPDKDWSDGLISTDNPDNVSRARLEWDPTSGSVNLNFLVNDITESQIYKHNNENGFYFNYDAAAGEATGYYRLMEIEKICDQQNFPPQTPCQNGDLLVGVKVTAVTQWSGQPGQTKEYRLSDYLYNWK